MLRKKPQNNTGFRAARNKMRFTPLESPERLVLVGFRCWQAGYETGDVNCWELAWNEYARELGVTKAKCAIRELRCWVRAVHKNACRNISYYPPHCRGCSQDEACAISLIAACQYDECGLAKARAFDLVANDYIDTVIETAQHYASAMTCVGRKLSSHSMQLEAGFAKHTVTSVKQHPLF